MVLENFSYGWIIIAAGAFFFVLEVFSPGFFLLVPGTVLLIIGVLVILGMDIFSSPYGIVLGIVIALLAAILTVYLYSRLTPGDEKPTTISMDSLAGKKGRVISAVDEDSLAGKVSIEGQIFSAKSKEGVIPEGAKVKVIVSHGVHIVVEEE
ncbi:MAG: NfeD family protein [Methanospirillum sp.]|nr:NfeD family protein [Methanospirillum sp.]